MSNDLQTRDKQNQEVDSSEQYVINTIGDKVLQSADYVVKESKRALEKAMGKRTIALKPSDSRVSTSMRAYQPVSTQPNTERQEEYAPEYAFPPQNEEIVHTWVNPAAQYEEEKQEPVVHADTVYDNIPAPSQEQGGNAVKRAASHKSEAKPSPAAKDYTPSNPKDSSHMRTDDNNLRLNEGHAINTWQNSPVTNSLQNQGAALHTAETSGATVQTFQAVGQTAGSAGASAAANAAAPGVGAAIQATEKAVTKIKETVENIAASAPKSTSSWGALAALFLLPLLIIAAIGGAFRGGGSAKNVGLSADVIALMPQISAACQTHGIPEYAPLVAAVIMQESGGRVDDVGGDVMQCAEGMGLPVGTSVSVEESINFGTGIIARNLREAGAAGPTDIPRISLALQGYNFGNGYISWALARGGYSKENAREFSEWQAGLHGWSGYGDINYVDNVLRYYQVSVGGMGEASAIADGRFAYPLPGHPWDTYPGHNGIDISFANCYGEPAYAVAAGTVRYVQDGWTPAYGVDGMWSFGNSVFIEHGDGWISAYGHLSGLAVASGETVAQGQLIGYIGSTGNSTGPHLHLALYHNGDAGIGGKNFAELAWPQFNTI
ncbi:peptidoglycan DD-metalloendopeptidase family protein [Acutalibacter muris]|uniref:peptidoglycan DD-metalloendopeptidase family protein n=1 Tax=Acutalibacter muris TaxID=1796620 RepID=UPI001C3E8B6B|nr:lysozyme family protein [Acutalibacter muris]